MDVCRVCLHINAKKDITLLMVLNEDNDEKHSCEEIMEFCLGIRVSLKENFSTKLCVKCYKKIIEFYQFKSLAIKNDAHLRSSQLQTVVLVDDTIKKEDSEAVREQGLTVLYENETCYEEPLVYMKEECKLEYLSDDELLSVFKADGDDDNEEVNLIIEEPKGRGKQIRKDEQRTRSTRKINKKHKTKDIVSTEEKKICDICGKEVRCLRTHMLTHDNSPKERFHCDMCGRTLGSKASMKKHITNRHLNITQECSDCGKSVKNLKEHKKLKHSLKPLPYQCVLCDRQFIYKTGLTYHMRIHTKNAPFECDVCGKRFMMKTNVALHIRQVHENERTHMCQFCSKTFFKKYQLQMHLRTHTKERPYECPQCDKKFMTSSILKNHLLVHGGDKKYACKMCDMSFISPKYLTTHMLSHIKDKKYPCQYCSVRFHRSDHRKRHEYTAHLKHAADGAHS